ncbi:PfaD family polyunsaturated fatty acid/polyketide biosynthesis protein [Telmatocola sphagniphila]|uniref:PfaD family polyunsaturated fatty acid/polyketide biosynthesis protein n=1 Tax=Telmatocola sphagniphila TaxID=1123043 RepID=A0A8E6B8K9_9BACT|nr:PfaD family polyunsaturated fatty acid/polyketide biosynthesis protein [Telmatocola sphagniphila]QVL33362.1 PfaD family polyunsaturated fatty acid/polyketide biosynthesis protein [Telmatocola sphagniphila]
MQNGSSTIPVGRNRADGSLNRTSLISNGATNLWTSALHSLHRSLSLFQDSEGYRFELDAPLDNNTKAYLPPLPLSSLGDSTFRRAHKVRFNYVTGAMANGIASTDIVKAMADVGMLGIFGAAGLSLDRVEKAIQTLQGGLGEKPYGFNLIHSPNEPVHEMATAELFLRYRVPLVEASAYLDITPAIVRYRLSGIRRSSNGQIEVPNRVIGKVSRSEVATRFLSPPPERLLKECLEKGYLSAFEVELGRQVPMADDITVEADSGGHTDNRPAISLLPSMIALRDRLQKEFHFPTPVRIGAAGGISTPASIAAALAMGAAYVVTGSVNQACVESGSCDTVRQMLAEADQADVIMAPAADMFEMGVKVQVLKRGTMFAMRASKLYELYRAYPSIEAIPAADRVPIEKNLFRMDLEEVWKQTQEYFQRRDPHQNFKAEADPKFKMALVFRWYLGQSSRWANAGEPSRRLDYQIWCGPAMGAFNEWTKGTYLEAAKNRSVGIVAKNLLFNTAIVLRRLQLKLQGIDLPDDYFPTQAMDPNTLEAKWKEAA